MVHRTFYKQFDVDTVGTKVDFGGQALLFPSRSETFPIAVDRYPPAPARCAVRAGDALLLESRNERALRNNLSVRILVPERKIRCRRAQQCAQMRARGAWLRNVVPCLA
jgi:hypothetical protein